MLHQGFVLVLTGEASDAVQHDHLCSLRTAVNGINSSGHRCYNHFWPKLTPNSANSKRHGAALAKQ